METMRRLFLAIAALSLVNLGLGCYHCDSCNESSGCGYGSSGCSRFGGLFHGWGYRDGSGCVHGVCDCDENDWCNPYGVATTAIAHAPAPSKPKTEAPKEKELE